MKANFATEDKKIDQKETPTKLEIKDNDKSGEISHQELQKILE